MLESMRRAAVLLAVVAMAALSTAHARADDKQQCLAASDQGQQMRDDGKYRRAREAFAACARDACPALVRRDCVKWLADLDQSSPSIVVGAKDDKGGDLVDVTVLVDGAPLVTKLDGKPVLVDPGAHVLRFETRGYPRVEQHVMVHAGEKSRLLVVQFGTPAPPAPAARPAAPSPAAPPQPDTGATPQGTRTSAWVFGGLAVVAFGTEAYFGFTGLSDRSSLKAQPCAQRRARRTPSTRSAPSSPWRTSPSGWGSRARRSPRTCSWRRRARRLRPTRPPSTWCRCRAARR
jgi:hypothetical protein